MVTINLQHDYKHMLIIKQRVFTLSFSNHLKGIYHLAILILELRIRIIMMPHL
jgi:hypothetical protein